MLAVAAMGLACSVGLGGPPQPEYKLPLAEATEWQVLVFAAYVPEAERAQAVPFEVEVRWTGAGDGQSKLAGQVKWQQIERQKLALPAGCTGVSLRLSWPAERARCDLDLGLEQVGTSVKLAPLFTTLRDERLLYNAETLPLYQWLTTTYAEWWRGYPFWAELPPKQVAP
jgi:hypothetical protein